MMTDCVFCKIISGEVSANKIYEDENYIAFLDLFPNTEGQTLVIPKKHFHSYAFDMLDEEYSKLLLVAKKVAKLLDKKLGVKRTAMVMEGLGIDHVHIKLYPLHGLDKKFEEGPCKEGKYIEKYLGYLTTEIGPKADDEKLKKLAERIREDAPVV